MPKTKSPFTRLTYQFLTDLTAHNNREWFIANKERYERDVREPMLSFVASLQKPVGRISRYIVADSSPHGGSMFRIYRDMRFSPDKTPYKTHVAVQFRHRYGQDAHGPGFYLHIALDRNIAGGGIWHPGNPALALIRARIDAKPKEWKKVLADKKFHETCGDVSGDKLVQPPRGYDPKQEFIEYIKLKDFWSGVSFQRSYVLSPGFREEVIEVFQAASPLMKFLCDALGFPW